MKHLLHLFILFLTVTTLHAQSRYGHLTIVSEESEPFFIYLNGIKYNHEALSVIRIEELSEKTYNCKIEYANKRLPTVNIDKLQVADYDGYMQDITYLLSTRRRGNNALMVYKIIPMDDIGIDISKEELYLFGHPGKPYRKGRGTFSPGSSRKRRSTFSEGDRKHLNSEHQNDRRNTDRRCQPMSSADFTVALSTVKSTTFDDNKLNVAQTISKTNCLSTDQIIDLIKALSFEKNKLAFAKFAYAYTYDPNNYYKVVNSFSFSSSKEELSNFIANQSSR